MNNSIIEKINRFSRKYARIQIWVFNLTSIIMPIVLAIYFVNSMATIDHSNFISLPLSRSIMTYLTYIFFVIYMALALGAAGRRQWGWAVALIVGFTIQPVLFLVYYFSSYKKFLTEEIS